ncbi:hypothetical protein BESB_035670 [Besnoitia besnoiti]|uniref:Uncharacterized protein n=1 Tax=Besnoitia besnoiti TaxID=94643 RepID=A0A2A9MGS2_BESBE|nr:hypothetical protein BESB_035670 [Besnoitia besnoiti]PFH37109.1 hypothetical protein BESB_035670 [Besnoitia besnoiti]
MSRAPAFSFRGGRGVLSDAVSGRFLSHRQAVVESAVRTISPATAVQGGERHSPAGARLQRAGQLQFAGFERGGCVRQTRVCYYRVLVANCPRAGPAAADRSLSRSADAWTRTACRQRVYRRCFTTRCSGSRTGERFFSVSAGRSEPAAAPSSSVLVDGAAFAASAPPRERTRKGEDASEQGASGSRSPSSNQTTPAEGDPSGQVELLEARRKEVVANLPAYIRLVEAGPHQVFIYPVIHGNSLPTSPFSRRGGCGSSTEVSQLIRVMRPDFVFFSADPETNRSAGASGSQFHEPPFALAVLPRVYGGFLPFSDIREPLMTAESADASVGFLDRSRAATRNRLHQQLLQNTQYCRTYLDYAAACKALKHDRTVKSTEGEKMLKKISGLSHQLMYNFPGGFETLVVERARYMAGRLAECLFHGVSENSRSLAAPREPCSSSEGTFPRRVVSLVVCDSVLAERLGHAVKRIMGDSDFIKQYTTKHAVCRASPGDDLSSLPSQATDSYKNPHARLAAAPPSQVPLLFFQIFLLPSLLAVLLMWQVQLLLGMSFTSRASGDLPILNAASEPVELDLGGEGQDTSRAWRRTAGGLSGREGSGERQDNRGDRGKSRIRDFLHSWCERLLPCNLSSAVSSGPLKKYTDRDS